MSGMLLELPPDIYLEISTHLLLIDVLSLLLTCRTIYQLGQERSFWISLLRVNRAHSPLACPVHTDLSQWPLERLKNLAFIWMNVYLSWSSPAPRFTRPVSPLRFPEPVEFVASLQGTSILLLHFKERQQLVCWDTRVNSKSAVPTIPFHGQVVETSVAFESLGITAFVLGRQLFAAPSEIQLHIVTICHEEDEVSVFTCTQTQMTSSTSFDYESFLLTEEFVGSVGIQDSADSAKLMFGRRFEAASGDFSVSEIAIKAPRQFSSDREQFVCFPFQGHFYNLFEDGLSVHVRHVSRNSLLHNDVRDSIQYVSLISADADDLHPFCYTLPTSPVYGIAAAFVRNSPDELDVVRVTFLPCSLTHSDDDGVQSPLAFDPLCRSVSITGNVRDRDLIWMDHSGSNILLVIETLSFTMELKLIRYHLGAPGSITVHSMVVPESIDIDGLRAVCIDDSTGAVYVIDSRYMFYTLQYA